MIGERERIALYRIRFIEGWLGFRSRFGYAHISGDVWSESCRLQQAEQACCGSTEG